MKAEQYLIPAERGLGQLQVKYEWGGKNVTPQLSIKVLLIFNHLGAENVNKWKTCHNFILI